MIRISNTLILNRLFHAPQVQKDALQKDYSNIKYEQPYQTAMYNQSLLFEAKRWHVHSYEEALLDLTPTHLQVLRQSYIEKL